MRISVIQMSAQPDVEANLAVIRKYIAGSAQNGADLVVFPEAAMFPFDAGRLDTVAQPLDGPFARAVAATAEEHGIVAVVGMFTPAGTVYRLPSGELSTEKPENSGGTQEFRRVKNTLLVAGPGIFTHYDKIHSFDAFGFQESATVRPGDRRVTFELKGIPIGLATCYDVRFPGHFIELAKSGAKVVVLPTSWADGPGKLDQWRALTSARALDASVYLVAAGMARPGSPEDYGKPEGPTGIGHSVVVSPQGAKLAETGYAAQVLTVDIDPNLVDKTRKALPVLVGHDRDTEVTEEVHITPDS